MFAVPVWALLWARRATDGWARRGWLWAVPLIFLAHAVVSELIQGAFYAHRSGDPADVAADSLGVVLGLAAALLLDRMSHRSGRAGRAGPADDAARSRVGSP